MTQDSATQDSATQDGATQDSAKPCVLFVCSTNAGKSQMAAALMRASAGDRIDADSGGVDPGEEINALAAQSLLEVGADMSAERPKAIDPELLRSADRIVILGSNAQLEPVDGVPTERWEIDEPADRGIEGEERMRLIRDDIAAKVQRLAQDLAP